ncbi:MAG: hypothetical protein Q8Q32_01015 [bacterium]|nr:hypothetical protein [bacterium]
MNEAAQHRAKAEELMRITLDNEDDLLRRLAEAHFEAADMTEQAERVDPGFLREGFP